MPNYLYNGVELSQLPESEYANACIVELRTDALEGYERGMLAYRLMLYSEVYPHEYGETSDGGLKILEPPSAYSQTYMCSKYNIYGELLDETEWTYSSSDTSTEHSKGIWEENDASTMLWSNFNIYNEDGSLFLAASDPVLVEEDSGGEDSGGEDTGGEDTGGEDSEEEKTATAFNLESWIMGFVTRLASRAHVYYWFGDVRLPKKPVYDEEAYPHAYVITGDLAGEAVIIFSASAQRWVRTSEGITSGEQLWYYFGNGWDEPIEITEQVYSDTVIKWCNTDILNEDGTVWMAATEPVPDYGGGET